MSTLPVPVVLRSYVEDRVQPPIPALHLRWQAGARGPAERIWDLPEGVTIVGPAPERFGVSVQRRPDDAFAVRLMWDRTCLSWGSVSRAQLMTSALEPVLRALGQDLRSVLDGATQGHARPRLAA